MVKHTFAQRKAFHLIAGTALLAITASIIDEYGIGFVRIATLAVAATAMLFDYIRITQHVRVPVFNAIIKKKEENRLLGLTHALIAAAILLYLVDARIALASLAMLVIGDPLAAIAGNALGARRKTVLGSVACFAGALAGGGWFLGWSMMLVFMAGAAALAERYAGRIDDNLLIPLIAGLVGHVLA